MTSREKRSECSARRFWKEERLCWRIRAEAWRDDLKALLVPRAEGLLGQHGAYGLGNGWDW
jgi:hypothetical protein